MIWKEEKRHMKKQKSLLSKACVLVITVSVGLLFMYAQRWHLKNTLHHIMEDEEECLYEIVEEKIIIKDEDGYLVVDFSFPRIQGISNEDEINKILYEPIRVIVEESTRADSWGYSRYEIAKKNSKIISVVYTVEYGLKGRWSKTVNVNLEKGELITLSQLKIERQLHQRVSCGEYEVISYFTETEGVPLESLMARRGMLNEELVRLFKRDGSRFYLKDDLICIMIDTWIVADEIVLGIKYEEL